MMGGYACTAACTPTEGHERGCRRFSWADPRARARYASDPENPDRAAAAPAPAVAVLSAGAPVAAGTRPRRRVTYASFQATVEAGTAVRLRLDVPFPFQGESLIVHEASEASLVQIRVGERQQLASPTLALVFRELRALDLDVADAESALEIVVDNPGPGPAAFSATLAGLRLD